MERPSSWERRSRNASCGACGTYESCVVEVDLGARAEAGHRVERSEAARVSTGKAGEDLPERSISGRGGADGLNWSPLGAAWSRVRTGGRDDPTSTDTA